MFECFIDGETFLRVKRLNKKEFRPVRNKYMRIANQCLGQKVNGFLGRVGEKGCEGTLLANGQCTYIVA